MPDTLIWIRQAHSYPKRYFPSGRKTTNLSMISIIKTNAERWEATKWMNEPGVE